MAVVEPLEQETVCPRCGAEAAPLQEYCLECGARLPPSAVEGARSGLLRPAPGGWAWPVLASLVVALLAAAAALTVELTRDESAGPLFVATTEQPVVIPIEDETVPQTETLRTASPPATPPAAAAPTLPTPRAGPRQLAVWPAGRNGWTVIVASIPADGGRTGATAKAKEASDAGLSRVGVLDSSEYSSLHPGYFVVFSGVYDSQSAAENAVSTARDAGYDAAYAREIAP